MIDLREEPRGSLRTEPRAPTPPHRRSLAPDLARGMMLLFIALANVVIYLYDRKLGHGGRPADGTPVDRVCDTLVSLFIDSRSYPMFAILVGFGTATMARRMGERGMDARRVRRVLARRNLALLALGMIHAMLLFSGDVLAIYGAAGLIALSLVHRRSAVLWRWIAPSGLGMVALLAFAAWSEPVYQNGTREYLANANYLETAVIRFVDHVFLVLLSTLLLYMLGLVLIGMLVARSGILERPRQHVPALRRIVFAGFTVNIVGGLPYALAVGGVWHPARSLNTAVLALHGLSGVGMGLAYICGFALLAARAETRGHGAVTRLVAAAGERSLSCYLLQSMLFAPLLSAWGLGLGARIGTTQAYTLATGVWVLGIACTAALVRAGRRGPFEVVLRRLTYGPGECHTR